MKRSTLIAFGLLALAGTAVAQDSSPYNARRGQNVIEEDCLDEKGEVRRDADGRAIRKRVKGDKWGNAQGSQYDLVVDGAFEGQTIVVLHLYTAEGFDFSLPRKALKQKGFSTYRFCNRPPKPEDLKAALDKACQFWLISSNTQMLTDEHLKVIKEFFDAGHGVYIWGDNEPYYADANFVAQGLLGVTMSGNLMGNQTVSLRQKDQKAGLTQGHDITTGLEYVYEGITIATLADNQVLTPLLYGSAGNLVTATFEKDGKRAILDGGFTRLYCNWDTAGTGRYVMNAAAWLVNYDRFGKQLQERSQGQAATDKDVGQEQPVKTPRTGNRDLEIGKVERNTKRVLSRR